MAHEDIISLTEFKADAAGWVERLQSQPAVILTQNGRGRAVVQSYDEYERARAELALVLRLNRALADDGEGRTATHAQVVARTRARLRNGAK